jgi:hypothetical protein
MIFFSSLILYVMRPVIIPNDGKYNRNFCTNLDNERENVYLYPPLPEGGEGILFYLCPSKILCIKISKIGKRELGIWWGQKHFPWYGVPKWSLWQNIRFLPSIFAEKNATKYEHICSMCILDSSDSYFLFADLVGFYTHWTYMHIFRHIFLSNYWWQYNKYFVCNRQVLGLHRLILDIDIYWIYTMILDYWGFFLDRIPGKEGSL